MQKLAVKAYWEQLTKMSIGEGLKKIWIYPYLGGWVFQDGDNIHKKNQKNMPLKSI